MIEELDSRFSHNHEGLVAVQYLVHLCLSKLSEEKIEAIKHFYNKYLTYEEKETLNTEITKWRKCYESVSLEEQPIKMQPSNISYSSQNFDNFPNDFSR